MTMPDTLEPALEAALAPCPFCGGHAIAVEDTGTNGEGYMRCQTCFAAGPVARNPNGVSEAKVAWSKRVVSWTDAFDALEVEVANRRASPQAEIDRLREALLDADEHLTGIENYGGEPAVRARRGRAAIAVALHPETPKEADNG
jgi:hypothetical protein